MILSQAPLHELLVFTGAGSDPHTTRRLQALGMRKGAKFKVVQRLSAGACVVSVEGARLALDQQLLTQITVELVSCS